MISEVPKTLKTFSELTETKVAFSNNEQRPNCLPVNRITFFGESSVKLFVNYSFNLLFVKPDVFIVILKGSHSSSKMWLVFENWFIIDWYMTQVMTGQSASPQVPAWTPERWRTNAIGWAPTESYISQLPTNVEKLCTILKRNENLLK